jgi:hypothetical protein
MPCFSLKDLVKQQGPCCYLLPLAKWQSWLLMDGEKLLVLVLTSLSVGCALQSFVVAAVVCHVVAAVALTNTGP